MATAKRFIDRDHFKAGVKSDPAAKDTSLSLTLRLFVLECAPCSFCPLEQS